MKKRKIGKTEYLALGGAVGASTIIMSAPAIMPAIGILGGGLWGAYRIKTYKRRKK